MPIYMLPLLTFYMFYSDTQASAHVCLCLNILKASPVQQRTIPTAASERLQQSCWSLFCSALQPARR